MSLKASLGERGTAGQLQQRPAPAGGAIFKRDWWQVDNRFDAGDSRFWNLCVGRWLSFDTALKDKESNDFTSMGVWELTADYRLAQREVWWRRLQFPQLASVIEGEALRWNRDGRLRGVIIEDKGSGTSALQTLRQGAPEWLAEMLVGFEPRGSKEGRARQASLWCERGCVLLPFPGASAPWLLEFEDDFLFKFPAGAFDDPVDQWTQMVIYLEHYLAQGWRSRLAPG
jgi:predicted phage terminase large subunit-like protein